MCYGKKTKKLQLRKETISVLNGEKMSYVVGGNDSPCKNGGIFDGKNCFCPPEFEGQNCEQPMDIITLWPTDICPYSLKDTCVNVCNTFEKTCLSCENSCCCA